tara:strand:+ start:141 stop:446 length:306 start_codon:yes stop_codon:yes gene_type:complete
MGQGLSGEWSPRSLDYQASKGRCWRHSRHFGKTEGKKTNKIVLKHFEVGLVAREKRRDVVVYAISHACRDLILKVSHSRQRLIDEMADICRKEKYCQIWGT